MEPHAEIDQEALKRSKLIPSGTAAQLRKLEPEALAAWQTGFKNDTPKWLLAEKEWQRRFVRDAAASQRYAAWLGVVGTVVGAAIAIIGQLLLGK